MFDRGMERVRRIRAADPSLDTATATSIAAEQLQREDAGRLVHDLWYAFAALGLAGAALRMLIDHAMLWQSLLTVDWFLALTASVVSGLAALCTCGLLGVTRAGLDVVFASLLLVLLIQPVMARLLGLVELSAGFALLLASTLVGIRPRDEA